MAEAVVAPRQWADGGDITRRSAGKEVSIMRESDIRSVAGPCDCPGSSGPSTAVSGAGTPGRDLWDNNPNKHRCLLYEFAPGKPKVMPELIKR